MARVKVRRSAVRSDWYTVENARAHTHKLRILLRRRRVHEYYLPTLSDVVQ